jgi:hypothetical protein
MAKKNQLNVSIGVDTKGYEKSWDEAIKITQESGSDLEKEAAKMALAVSKKIEKMSPKSQARQLETLTTKMIEMGMEGTQAFNMVIKSAAGLKATIDDAKGMIDAMRPDAPFNALNTTLGASAQAFAGVQGAMALFGAESEDLQKTLIKVQGAMALAEGFKAIDGLTDGFDQLNKVIKQNPFIAGATIVTAVLTAMVAMTDSTKKLSESQKMWNDISAKSVETAIDEAGEVKALSSIILDESKSRKVRESAFNKLQDKYPNYLSNLSIEKSSLNELSNAIDKVTNAIFARAKVQAALDKITELGKQQLELDLAVQREQEKALTQQDMGAFGKGGFDDAMKTRTDYLNYLKKEIARQQKELTDFIGKQDSDIVASVLNQGGKEDAKPKAEPPKLPLPKGGIGLPKTSEIPVTDEYENPIPPVKDSVIESYDNLGLAILLASEEFRRSLEPMSEWQKQVENTQAAADAVAAGTMNVFDAMGSSMADSLDTGSEAMNAFGGQMIKTITKLIGMALSNALANAIVGGTQAGVATGPAAPFSTPAFIATAIGGVMAAFATIPKFETGGVVGGSSYHGDKILARVNSGELILNGGQQRAVLAAMSGSGYMAETRISGRDLAIVLKKYQIDNARG